MAMTPEIENHLHRENLAIAEAAQHVEGALIALMDLALQDFEQTRQFAIPPSSSSAALVDALGVGWQAGAALGEEQIAQIKQTQLDTRGAVEYIRQYGLSRARRITETTAKQLTQFVIKRQRAGMPVPDIMRELVDKVPAMAATRAKIIAATEVHSAAQFGAYNAALRGHRTLVKVWNTVEDDAVRDFRQGAQFSHAAMEGVKIALDIPFLIPHSGGGTEPLRFPGDPEGSAGNVINCRCVVTYEEA